MGGKEVIYISDILTSKIYIMAAIPIVLIVLPVASIVAVKVAKRKRQKKEQTVCETADCDAMAGKTMDCKVMACNTMADEEVPVV
jgi:hypothetical protein